MRRLGVITIGILVAALIVAGCGGGSRNDDAAAPLAPLPGVYTSTVFVEPGASDVPVDVHSAGGYLNLTLGDSFAAEGKLVIPPGVGSNYDSTNATFEGTWRRAGRNVVVEGTGLFIDGAEWRLENGLLVTERSGRGRLEIRLQRVH
jgi:hypothetical protein